MSSPAPGDRTLVIRNGTMIDGSGRAPTPNDALVVEGNRITFVVNMKTAQQIGLTIPQSVLFRADKVIK
jgi:hypothetical protein